LKIQKGIGYRLADQTTKSASGWLGNVEEFKVFRSWDASESKYLNNDSARFNNFGRVMRSGPGL